MLFSTTYPDDRIDKSSPSGHLPMEFNLEHGEFSVSMTLRVGGPFSMDHLIHLVLLNSTRNAEIAKRKTTSQSRDR